MLAVLLGGVGCGGSKSGNGNGSSDETIHVKGTISLRGSTPFELLLLKAEDGKVYMIDSSPDAIELKRLVDMDVAVTATVLPDVGGDAPALSVYSYELLPLSTGERPVVGVIYATSPDAVYLMGDDGNTWKIDGEFEMIFSGFSGAKIWIVGDIGTSINTARGNARSIYVTQYGMIREAN